MATMDRPILDNESLGNETMAKRVAVGVAIIAAHVGLILLFAASGFVVPTLVQSVAVTFLQETPTQPNRPQLTEPTLRPVQQIVVPPPDIDVQVESTNPIAAVESETVPPPPATSIAPVAPAGRALPEMTDVAYVVQPAPHYPPESRRIREQGLVVLRVIIDESGHAKQIEIYRSSGHPRLDEAARAAVARAIFRPMIDGGVARAAAAMVPVEFSLRTSSS
jgi:periplasmic protein TonB